MTVLDVVADEIRATGPIRFSRYMELALYDADLGFYAHRGAGRRKDFITSPEVGSLFGTVVAGALDSWWAGLGRPDRFVFVDAGAGSGALARSILRAQPECVDALEYVAVEVSAAQRSLHPPEVNSTADMPASIKTGVVLANELLDNLPFEIVQFDPGVGWREVRIGWIDGGIAEVLVETEFEAEPSNEQVRMPVQNQAARWLRDAFDSLDSGWVIAFDYAVPGYPVSGERGWLRTYSEHTRDDRPLDAPGTKDITADIAIGALDAVVPIAIRRNQRTWLRQHGIDDLVDAGRAYWREHAAKPNLAAMAMRSRVTESEALLDPAGLGAFVVLEWLALP